MLIHLTPSYYLKYSNISANLIGVEVPELGLHLRADHDITVRYPSRNKQLHYVCRKKGRKAIYGILLETDRPVTDFTLITRWAVQGNVSVHRVHMHISGEGEAAADLIHLWSAFSRTTFDSRIPAAARNWTPASCQPRLTVSASDRPSEREPEIWRRADPGGIVREQTEFFTMAAVEPERLVTEWWGNDRLPPPEDAFPCTVRDVPGTLRVLYPRVGVTVCPLSEQAELIKSDLQREGMTEAWKGIMEPVLNDVRRASPVFFTNTSNLMDSIRRHSGSYQALSEADKRFVSEQIHQPLFQVSDC